MASGTIKSIRTEKGFGFIAPEGASSGNDLFFHHSAVADGGFDAMHVGQQVSFDEGPDPRDPSRRRANNVRLAEED
jgi:cold shock protein